MKPLFRWSLNINSQMPFLQHDRKWRIFGNIGKCIHVCVTAARGTSDLGFGCGGRLHKSARAAGVYPKQQILEFTHVIHHPIARNVPPKVRRVGMETATQGETGWNAKRCDRAVTRTGSRLFVKFRVGLERVMLGEEKAVPMVRFGGVVVCCAVLALLLVVVVAPLLKSRPELA